MAISVNNTEMYRANVNNTEMQCVTVNNVIKFLRPQILQIDSIDQVDYSNKFVLTRSPSQMFYFRVIIPANVTLTRIDVEWNGEPLSYVVAYSSIESDSKDRVDLLQSQVAGSRTWTGSLPGNKAVLLGTGTYSDARWFRMSINEIPVILF